MPHILLVEDYEPVLHAISETLAAEGWQVECCAHGLLALSKINSQEPYELLVSDNELSGISGLELTRQVRRLLHRKEMPVIVISASECGREAREAGADEFLKKPEGMNALVATISRLINA